MSEPWDGKERRATPADLNSIMELLHEMKTAQELHLQEEQAMRPKLEEIVTILERSKGVVTFIKYTAGLSAGLAALLVWAKDHIKL